MTRARVFLGMATSVHAISGNIQFGTCPIQIIVTLGHVISGQARFGTAQLHNLKLLCTDCSHGKSVQAPIRLKCVTINPVYDCLGRLATASERLVRLISFHIRGWAIIIDIRAPNRTEAIEDVMRMCKLSANIPSWQLREQLLSAVRTRPGRTTDMRPRLSEVNGVRRTRQYLEDRLKTQEADASGEFVDIISTKICLIWSETSWFKVQSIVAGWSDIFSNAWMSKTLQKLKIFKKCVSTFDLS